MKNRNTTPTWSAFALLALMIMALYSFVPRPKAQGCGTCAGASVTVKSGNQSATWHDPASPGEDNVPPTMSTNGCSEATASGFAFIADGPCQTSVFTSLLEIKKGGTGVEVEMLTNNSGLYYRFHDAKKPGTVTITSTISGNVTNCNNGCTQKVVKAVGYLSIVPCDGGGCGSTCSANASGPSPGTAVVDNNSIDFHLNFGAIRPGISYEFLWLKVETPTGNLAQPALLNVPYSDPLVEVITNISGVIQQINTPQMLINIRVLTSYDYHLECFYATNVTSNVGGLYGTNAAAFVTWDILNPDGVTNYNRLWITELRGGSTRQFQYTYLATNMQWDLLEPNGQILSTWKTTNSSSLYITNYYSQISVGGQIASKSLLTYKYVPGIDNILPLQAVNGFGSVTQLTSYAYYTNGPATNQLQEVIYPDGNWSYYTYDGNARKVLEYSAFGNSPAPTPGVEPDPIAIQCKVTQYDYSLTNAVDGLDESGDYSPWTERKTTVFIPFYNGSSWLLKEVSRTYHLISGTANGVSSEERQQCVFPGAFYDSSSPSTNLQTVTTYYTGTSFPAGRIYSIGHPDATVTTFAYPDTMTTIEYDPDGSTTTALVDQFGNLQSRIKTDNGTGVVLAQTTYSYTNSSGVLYDLLLRSHDETDLGGRTTHYSYDCCTLESMTDPDGITTSYTYDTLKRRIASTVYYGGSLGITTSNSLDAVGQTQSVTRFGTNNSPIILSQSQYDSVGRVIAQTNGLGGVTVTTNVLIGGQLCVTNINADGGTQAELHNLDGTIQSITGTAVHGVRFEYGTESDGGFYRTYTKEIKLNTDGTDSSEWTKTYYDGVGRTYKTVYAAASGPYPSSQSFFTSNGRVWKSVDPDGVTMLYLYNNDGDINQGQQEYTIGALSSTALAITSYSGLLSQLITLESLNDRITQIHRSVVAATGGKPDLIAMDKSVWLDGESTGTTISHSENSTAGTNDWNIIYGDANTSITNSSQTILGSSRVVTMVAPDNAYTVSTYSYGQLASVTRYDSSSAQIASTSFSYDSHGRQYQVTDARNGMTTYGYNDADLVNSVTTPNPGNGDPSQTTVTYYNRMLQATNVVNPDGTGVTNEYSLTGELKKTYGSRTYPVAYTYDYAGRVKTMTNWSGFSGGAGARVTTWKYDGYRGSLTNKVYDANTAGPSYSYTDAGRLARRAWARGVTTTYYYDNAGGLTNAIYSDSTPAVTNHYDRLGRLSSAVCGGVTNTFTYNLVNAVLSETYSGGILNGLSVTNRYDQYLRRTNLTALASGILNRAAYSYDNASRLSTVSDGTNNAAYSYLANSPLVSQIVFKSNSVTRMTTAKQYDYLNRLTSISSSPSSAAAVSDSYTYNNANQRVRSSLVDGSYWLYNYDSLGQVTSGHKYFSDLTPVAGQQFDYTFDDIGNRNSTKTGGDETGANQRLASYTNNTLNQITGRDVPGYVDIKGISIATNTVTVAGLTAYRKGEYFRKELSVGNSSEALWSNIVVAATGQTSVTGNVFVAKAPETYTYDLDGNLTSDGRWTNTWDGENRLVNITSLSNAPTASKLKLDFAYDSKSRRIQKIVSTNSGSAYVGQSTNKFLYDGWNLIAELIPNGSLIRSYVWGLDLSGTMQGAGGVGGLMEMSYYGSSTTNSFVAYDGNGNVVALVNAGDGTIVASYEFGPFGEVVRATGPLAKINTFQFSTKYQDYETELLYYGYRFYNCSQGRWLNRDPIEEEGGLALCSFNSNDALNFYDLLGNKATQKYYLSYETDNLIPGLCGDFSWRIKWHVSSSKKAKNKDDVQDGWIYQHVIVHYNRLDTCGTKSKPPADLHHYEGFIWYPGKADTWRPLNVTGGTEGKITITGTAFYSQDALPTPQTGWSVTRAGSDSDFEGDSASKVPTADSNTVTRKLIAEWYCCPNPKLTTLTTK